MRISVCREPQPGLALLRMAQGRLDVAEAAMRRVLAATSDPLKRTRYLPAHVEIMLASGNNEEARRASDEHEANRRASSATAARGTTPAGRARRP